MQIYHSNTIEIAVPKLKTTARNGDFGSGIYMFVDKEEAQLRAGILARREELPFGIVSFFEIPICLMSYSALRIKQFKRTSAAWLDFVLKNRMKPQKSHSYDIVSGPACNDDAYACLNAYESGFMERDELLNILKSCKLPKQILFHTASIAQMNIC